MASDQEYGCNWPKFNKQDSTGLLATTQINNDNTLNGRWDIHFEMTGIKTTGSKAIMMNNEFHIIGGDNHKKHVKWNDESKQFDVLHQFADKDHDVTFNYTNMVRLGDRVLAFGGYELWHFDNIYVHSVQDKKFTVSKIKCPDKGMFKAISVCDKEWLDM